MKLVHCTFERHAAAILEILNDAIIHSTALYDYSPRPPESMVGWFRTKEGNGYPVVGAESADGQLLGFASYGEFRAWPAYKYSVESGIYVHRDHRGHGVGATLMRELIATARHSDLHLLVAAIDMDNAASIALHEGLGFTHAGTIRQVAFKFGRWLDLGLFQLLLDTPAQPFDGIVPRVGAAS